MRLRLSLVALAAAFALTGVSAGAQVDANLLEVGAEAPDFALTGATQYGMLQDPVRLSDYRGSVVVLGFFFRVRTRG